MKFRQLIGACAVVVFAGSAMAQNDTVGNLHIGQSYARATAPGQPSAGAYISVTNNGKTADKLLSAASPAAKNVEIHTMSMEGNIMKMRALDSLEVPPGQTVKMQPSTGAHIMLMGLQQPLKEGDAIPMTLVFEKAGKIQISVKVQALTANANASTHAHH